MGLPPQELSTVEDFLEYEAFRVWLIERRPEDQLFWQQWLENNPEKRNIYEEAVTTFLLIQGNQNIISNQEVIQKKNEILMQLEGQNPKIIPLFIRRWSLWFTAAAAVIVLTMFAEVINSFSFFGSGMLSIFNKMKAEEGWNKVENNSEITMVVLLPDSSSVILSPGSNLRFLKQPREAKREVYLEGEGFFEVVRNPSKPFVVYTNSLITKVLGTSFRIRSFKKENTSFVKVNTGEVAVFPVASTKETVLLSKNEQFNLEIKKERVVRQNVITLPADVINKKGEPFKFEYAPLPEVFSTLQESYNIEILYDPQLMSDCTFTGQLNGLPLLEKLKLICLATDSSYELNDRTVVIHSTGCH